VNINNFFKILKIPLKIRYDFIHSKNRNRQMDIWFIHVYSNLRLGDKIPFVNNSETTVEWEQWTSDYR